MKPSRLRAPWPRTCRFLAILLLVWQWLPGPAGLLHAGSSAIPQFGLWQDVETGPSPRFASPCDGKIYAEYRSYEAWREKPGFDTFVPATPRRKYLSIGWYERCWATNLVCTNRNIGTANDSGDDSNWTASITAITAGNVTFNGNSLFLECESAIGENFIFYEIQQSTNVSSFGQSNSPSSCDVCAGNWGGGPIQAGKWARLSFRGDYHSVDAVTNRANPCTNNPLVAIQFTQANASANFSWNYSTNSRPGDPWQTNGTPLITSGNCLHVTTNSELKTTLRENEGFTPGGRAGTLSNEYTTAMLKAFVSGDALRAATNCPPPAWGQGAGYHFISGCTNSTGTNLAYLSLSSDETQARACALQFCWEFASDPCSVYTLTWSNITVLASGTTNITNYTLGGQTLVTGVGGRARSTPQTIPPPPSHGYTRIWKAQIQRSPNFALPECREGCPSCGDGQPIPGSAQFGLNSVMMRFPLGWTPDGSSSGSLVIEQEYATALLVDPAGLKFEGDSTSVTLVRDSNNVIQRVDAPQVQAVVQPAALGYSLQFHPMVGGQYATTSSVSYMIQAPSLPSYTALRVTEIRGTQIKIHTFNEIGQRGSWAMSLADGAWEERLTKFADTNTHITTFGRAPVGPGAIFELPFATVIDTYQEVNGATLLLSHTVDPHGLARTNSYTYDTAGRLTSTQDPDGAWAIYKHDDQGRLLKIFLPWGNTGPTEYAPNCRTLDFDYQALPSLDCAANQPDSPRRIIERAGGVEFRRTYMAYPTGQVVTVVAGPAAPMDDPSNVCSTSTYFTDGPFRNELKVTDSSDGTRQSYSYQANGPNVVVTQWSGERSPAGPTNVLNGTRTETTYNPAGAVLSVKTFNLENPQLVLSSESSQYDEWGRLRKTDYLDGSSESRTYEDCCQPASVTDRQGVTTTFKTDGFGHLLSATRMGITTSNWWDDGRGNIIHDFHVVKTYRVSSDSPPAVMQTGFLFRDPAQRPIIEADALGNVTTRAYSTDTHGQRIQTTTVTDHETQAATTVVEVFYRDGRLRSVSGSGAHGKSFQYGIGPGGLRTTTVTLLDGNGAPTSESVTLTYDAADRLLSEAYPGGATKTFAYDTQGRLQQVVDPDGVRTLYEYPSYGVVRRAVSASATGGVNLLNDRVAEVVSGLATNADGAVLRRTALWVWPQPQSSAKSLLAFEDTSPSGLDAWQAWGRKTNHTRLSRSAPGVWNVTATAFDGTSVARQYQAGRLHSTTHLGAGQAALGQVTYSYDGFGRATTATDARAGVFTFQFDALDRVTNSLTPPPNSQSTRVAYDAFGRVRRQTLPDDTTVSAEYYGTGELMSLSGSRTYPAFYQYDYAGRLTNLTTWRAPGDPATAAATVWRYDSQRGWLNSVAYADYPGPAYTYTKAGRLRTRSWTRPITTTYSNSVFGDIARFTSTDGEAVSLGYDRLGRLTTASNAASLVSRVYDIAGNLLGETQKIFPQDLYLLTLTNSFDAADRRTQMALLSTWPAFRQSFTYDTGSGRLAAIENADGLAASYGYVPGASLLQQTSVQFAGAGRLTTTRNYDLLNRLTRIQNTAPAGQTFASFDPAYNLASQQQWVTNGDGSHWGYAYDPLGQLAAASRYWPDGTLVLGQQFGFTFDAIGNRTQTRSGGDVSGENLRAADYLPNALNQYGRRDVPGYVEFTGQALSNTAVSVNLQRASRQGAYFRAELPVANLGLPSWLEASIIAVGSGGPGVDVMAGVTSAVYVASSPEIFSHDTDGNLTADGRWEYRWDSENRLVHMESVPDAPEGARCRLDFLYDAFGRRVCMTNAQWDSAIADYGTPYTIWFAYDGWNLIRMLGPSGTPAVSFTWGLQGNGASQETGGQGGLLSMQTHAIGNRATYLYCYDAGGNVAALVNATNGAVAARYEYGPFGEPLRASGPAARMNPFRFSTQFTDGDTGLSYYGYRYYNPSTGRWLNRDPLGLAGGLNLYGFVGNDPVNWFDDFGMAGNPANARPGGYFPINEEIMRGEYYNRDPAARRWTTAEEISRRETQMHWNTREMEELYEPRLPNDSPLVEMRALTPRPKNQYHTGGPCPPTSQIWLNGPPSIRILRTADDTANGRLNPAEINFSQRTVSANLRQYADDMAAGNWDWSRSGPLRVMQRDGQWVSYDNRRLMAAQQAELGEVPIQVVQPGEPMPGSSLTWEHAFARRFSDPRNVQAGGVVPNVGLPTQPSIAPPRR